MTDYSQYNSIGIVGYPGAGKTILTDRLFENSDRKIIHTDDYLTLPHSEIPTALLTEISHAGGKYVIEGTHVVRLFERGWNPDLIIYVHGGKKPNCQSIRKMIDNKMKFCRAPVLFY